MTQLLYKKFVTFFENELNPSADMSTNPEWQWKTYKELFDAWIRGEVSLERVIKKSIFKEKERTQKGTDQVYIAHETISNGLVKDTILKFASLVKWSYDNLQSEAHKRDIFWS